MGRTGFLQVNLNPASFDVALAAFLMIECTDVFFVHINYRERVITVAMNECLQLRRTNTLTINPFFSILC